MEPNELNAYWSREFPDCPPVGFLLRRVYQDRWVRIRNFSEDGRTPETQTDYDEICSRQHEALSCLCGNSTGIVLITTSYSREEKPVRDQKVLRDFDPTAKFLHSVGVHELALEFDSPTYWHLFASEWKFERGRFDKVMRLAAEGAMFSGVFNVIFLEPETNRLMCLYEGGADVILEAPKARNQFRERFSDWAVEGL